MKHFFLLFCLLSFRLCYGQHNTSLVDDSLKKEMINFLIANKSKADLPGLYEELNDSTKVIRILSTGIVMKNVNTATYEMDLIEYMRVSSYDNYMFYNITQNGQYKIIGYYTHNEELDDQLTPPATPLQRSFLNDVSKYYNLDSVVYITIYGVSGICVMVNNNIWLINGNKRMDLKSYTKIQYPKYPSYRLDFLIKEEHWLSDHAKWR